MILEKRDPSRFEVLAACRLVKVKNFSCKPVFSELAKHFSEKEAGKKSDTPCSKERGNQVKVNDCGECSLPKRWSIDIVSYRERGLCQ